MFGKTDGIRAKAGEVPLVEKVVEGIGAAIDAFFADKNGEIWLARDTRESGVWIEENLRKKMPKSKDLGVLPTPVLAVVGKHAEVAAVMVTASHNPAEDNGIKVFDENGDKISDADERKIEAEFFGEHDESEYAKAFKAKAEKKHQTGIIDLSYQEQAESIYKKALRVQLDLTKALKQTIIVDAASGAGHKFSPAVLKSFGVTVRQIDQTPDGKNINKACGALFPEKTAKEAKQAKLVGVSYDGDADRIILIDETGRIWDGDRIVVLMAEYLKQKGELKSEGVVLTEYSNLATLEYLESRGIKVTKVVNGDREVAKKCLAKDLVLGGERSGHIIYLPWLSSSDGLFVTLMVLKIMQEMGKRLCDLWADYTEKPNRQWGVLVREKRPLEEIAGFQEAQKEAQKVLGKKGRVFCRYSGTENKLRILVEAEELAQAEEIGAKLVRVVTEAIGVMEKGA